MLISVMANFSKIFKKYLKNIWSANSADQSSKIHNRVRKERANGYWR